LRQDEIIAKSPARAKRGLFTRRKKEEHSEKKKEEGERILRRGKSPIRSPVELEGSISSSKKKRMLFHKWEKKRKLRKGERTCGEEFHEKKRGRGKGSQRLNATGASEKNKNLKKSRKFHEDEKTHSKPVEKHNRREERSRITERSV